MATSPPVWRPLGRLLKPYPAQTALLVVTIVFDTLFDSLLPLALAWLIDQAVTGRDLGLALALGSGVVVAWLVSVGSQMTRDRLYGNLTSAVLADLRVRIEGHLHDKDYARLRELRPGDVTGALGAELARLENLLLNVVPSFLFATLYLTFSLTAMAGTDSRLALFVAVLLPLAVVGPRLLSQRASQQGAHVRQQESDLAAAAQESLSAQPLVRTFGLAGRFRDAFLVRVLSLRDEARRFYWLTNLTRRTPNLTLQAIQLGMLVWGLVLLWQGSLGVGAFLAFNLLFLNILGAVLELSSTYGGWLAGGLAFSRLEPYLANPATGGSAQQSAEQPAVQPVTDPKSADGTGPASLTLEAVGFSFDAAKAVLHDLSFTLEAGQRTAIVGPSGSGKSTLAALLSGLHRPSQGRLLWNGQELQEPGRRALRSRLGVVFQENTILNASLEDNVRLGEPGDVTPALKAAGLEAWVHDLPQGVATPAGEAGGFLSGGQKQRLALARALFRRPGLLILDEATSALDPLSESLVNQTLRELAGSTTIVHITHRLEGIRDYDKILVLDKGRLAEQGTHDELLAQKGLYAALWSKQSGIEVTETSARLTPQALGAVPLFGGCQPALLAELSASFVSETAQPGQRVIRQGTPGSRFFVVARGRVDVSIALGDREQVVATLEDGDFFGEMSLLGDGKGAAALTSATVTARIPTILLALEKTTFQALIAGDPTVAERVRQTAQRRREENSRLQS